MKNRMKAVVRPLAFSVCALHLAAVGSTRVHAEPIGGLRVQSLVLERTVKNPARSSKKLGYSDCVVSPATRELFLVDNHGRKTVDVLDLDGRFKRSIPTVGFADMEGMIYLQGNMFAVVDEKALTAALKDKTIAGAGLDVLEGEEFLQKKGTILDAKRKSKDARVCLMNNILIDSPKTIVTPHNAFNTAESVERKALHTARNIAEFAKNIRTVFNI